MTTALQVAQTTVARASQSYVRNGMSYCQQFAGNFWEAAKGRLTPNSYSSAKAAMNASTIVSMDYNAAPPGAYHYFDYSVYGHVGVALGSGLMASGTGWATSAVANLGKSVYVHRVADYAAHLNYRGWAYTNGARERIDGLTDANAPVIAPNQRQVKAAISPRLRQVIPSTNSAYSANLAPNQIVTPDGYVKSEYEGGIVDGNPYWLKFGDTFASITLFTDQSGNNLADLGVMSPPKPVVFHTVTVKYLNLTDDVQIHQIEDGKFFAEPTAPARDLFNFKGWDFDFATPITADVTISAIWEEKPVIIIPEPGEPVDPTDPEPEVPIDPEPEEPTKPSLPTGGIVGIILGVIVAIAAVLAGIFGG